MTEKRSRVKRPYFRGNPWDQQTSVGFRETPKNYSRFLYWTQHDISFDDLAKQEGISIHTHPCFKIPNASSLMPLLNLSNLFQLKNRLSEHLEIEILAA